MYCEEDAMGPLCFFHFLKYPSMYNYLQNNPPEDKTAIFISLLIF